MIKKIPSNLQELADKNSALLERLDFNPGKDNPYELCNPDAYAQSGLFPDTVIKSMFDDERTFKGDASDLPSVASNIGMILIRPDMTHVSNRFESFISERYEIIHIGTPLIDSQTYWNLYQHDIYRVETMHTRLTRAAIYIGSNCNLFVFQDPDLHIDEPVADHMRNKLKGQQGIYEKDTLRGDIVYKSALELGLHILSDEVVDSRIKVAVDPFSIFRDLAARPDESIKDFVYPLLFYTGVGVHIPNYEELTNDLPLFIDSTTLLA